MTTAAAPRTRDVQQLRDLARGLPLAITDDGLTNGGRVYRLHPAAHPSRVLICGRYHVIAAFLAGWIAAGRAGEAGV